MVARLFGGLLGSCGLFPGHCYAVLDCSALARNGCSVLGGCLVVVKVL